MVENLIKKFLVLQFTLDTFHLEEELLSRGFSRKSCAPILKCYEILLFKWVDYLMKTSIALLCILKEEFRQERAAARPALIREANGRVQQGEDCKKNARRP